MDDLDLLRLFEPVLRFTQGELFFPTDVDGYVRRCGLWTRDPGDREVQIVPPGELTLERLATFDSVPPGQHMFLRFVQEPLDPLQYQLWKRRPERPAFRALGRLARVGLFTRLADGLYDLISLLRGRVPGWTAAAAEVAYRQMVGPEPRYVYYGRVVRSGGYIVLHYLFFYVMNNWRSGFNGVNDHEADWEQVFVYLSESQSGRLEPRWVAYAIHDLSGDDQRRRWDDPELYRWDEAHPVVYVGAGSHASYFLPGEYLMGTTPAFLNPVLQVLAYLRRFWVVTLGQGRNDRTTRPTRDLFRIPFIDYARGDGLSVGPDQDREWSPCLLTPSDGWAERYRGLWGLDTQDSLGGERAPGGPKFYRDGSLRLSWYNPLGFCGLDKVAPPNVAAEQLQLRLDSLAKERVGIEAELRQQRETVRLMELEVQALRESSHFDRLFEARQAELEGAARELQALYTRRRDLDEAIQAAKVYLGKIQRGDWGDPQAHLRGKLLPQPPLAGFVRLVEFWAAVSGGLLLLVFLALVLIDSSRWLLWTVLVLTVFIGLEETVRGYMARFLLNLSVVMAVITSLVLVYEFFFWIVIAAVVGMVIYMIAGNLLELFGR